MAVNIQHNIPKQSLEPENAVVYARYSSHGQTEQSIDGQIAEAHKYAAAHNYNVVHEYVDRAKTGRNDNREQFQKMLKDTAKKQFTVIIIWKIDRFGRNREEIAINKMKCRKNGVRVEYVAEAIPNTPEGVILESVLEGFAEYYSLQLSQNVKRGLAETVEKCQVTGGTSPLGYLPGPDKKYMINEKAAPTVKTIFRMYADGSTVNEIIDYLNGTGLRNRFGKEFTKNSLYSILRNEKYIGIYRYGETKIPGGMPRIIDDDTFYKVQEMMKLNRRAPSARWSKKEYLLTGKIFCGKCGSMMTGESGRSKTGAKYSYYLCSKKKHTKGCDKKAVRQDLIERLVIENTIELISNTGTLDFIVDRVWDYYSKTDENTEEYEALQAKLNQTETAIDNLIRAVEAGIINAATKRRMDELEEQHKQLTASLAEYEIARNNHITKDFIKYFIYQFRSLDYANLESRKKLISVFVNSVYVYDDEMLISFNYGAENRIISLSEANAAITEKSSDAVCYAPPNLKALFYLVLGSFFILFAVQNQPLSLAKKNKVWYNNQNTAKGGDVMNKNKSKKKMLWQQKIGILFFLILGGICGLIITKFTEKFTDTDSEMFSLYLI